MSALVLTSDTLLATPVAGTLEYSSPIQAFTPIGIQRGIVPSSQFYRLDSGLAGANATGAQNMLGVGVTLSASTVYAFEINIILAKTAGTTSHTISSGFGGTATLNNIAYTAISPQTATAATATAASQSSLVSASATAITGAITTASTSATFVIKGTVSINAGGTFIPQYTLSAAPGGAYTTQAGSYMLIYPVGASGSATNVGTWA